MADRFKHHEVTSAYLGNDISTFLTAAAVTLTSRHRVACFQSLPSMITQHWAIFATIHPFATHVIPQPKWLVIFVIMWFVRARKSYNKQSNSYEAGSENLLPLKRLKFFSYLAFTAHQPSSPASIHIILFMGGPKFDIIQLTNIIHTLILYFFNIDLNDVPDPASLYNVRNFWSLYMPEATCIPANLQISHELCPRQFWWLPGCYRRRAVVDFDALVSQSAQRLVG
ncbi:hypothetical protein B0F90DRAFT_1668881 [Multifurca ochricompacta]|uniref:Uncharacterized protein n=1 Tax=Multifurca ochricompacta TaxID=376703 RepID=A0AAD4M499_9AGAM|nr:hypothetical protein B0F90DRAFT_1668881 [Multifurca ochricompacta]